MSIHRNRALIGIATKDMEALHLQPEKKILPAFFGFTTYVDTVPEKNEIEVTGCSQFKLYVNGKSILFGPCRSAKEVIYYDTLDIAPYLKTGENRIVMQVLSYPEKPADRLNMGPCYCYGDNRGPSVSLCGTIGDKDPADPENWRIWIDDSLHFNDYAIFLTGSMESVDGALFVKNPLLSSCEEPTGAESTELLHAAVIQSEAYNIFGEREGRSLRPRPIPLLYRKEKTFPGWTERTIAPHTQTAFVLDAGELTTAYFRIGFSGGAHAKVRMTYAESYWQTDADGKAYKGVRDDTSGYIDGMRDEFTVGGDTVYEPFRFRTFRFIEIAVETREAPLTILPQPYVETAYPLRNTKRPAFTEPEKEKLYDVALRTLSLCMHDTYEDCPYYEQLQYACDTRLEILFTYAATDDTRLPAQAIDLFASSLMENGLTQSRFPSRIEQVIPSFALHFVLMLEDYVKATGDYERVRPHIPIAERIVESFLSRRCEDGMLAPRGYWDYFDWTEAWAEKDAVNTPTAVVDGESALQNLFFVYAAQSLIRLLPHYGRSELAKEYERECGRLLDLVEQTCYVPDKGLYREGPRTDEYTQHTQIYAVLTGLARGEKARKLMERTLRGAAKTEDISMIPCSFMQRFYLFRALEAVGMYDQTEGLWQDWQKFLDLNCTTFPETPYSPRSDCHGWSALPLYEFARSK